MAGLGIEPGTPGTLVMSSTSELPWPISTVHRFLLPSFFLKDHPQILPVAVVNLSVPEIGMAPNVMEWEKY